MKIVLDVSDACEATAYPWWLILDPGKMWEGNAEGVAAMVTGPFFSRESAEEFLRSHQYHYKRHGGYSDKAAVYCHTGHKSPEYVKAFEEAKASVDVGQEKTKASLKVERAPGVPSRVEDEVLRQHPELRDGQRLLLRLNGCTTGPVYAGMLLPSAPEGSRLKLSDRTFSGEVDGFGYLIRCWQEDKP